MLEANMCVPILLMAAGLIAVALLNWIVMKIADWFDPPTERFTK